MSRRKKSRIHPKYKTKYRVTNWPEYDRALTKRGSLTLWISDDAIQNWEPQQEGRRGGQLRYSNVAIETALSLRLIFHLPLRQTEGFVRSVFELMDLDLSSPDHTTLSRRNRSLLVSWPKRAASDEKALIVDSSGLKIVDAGKWQRSKHLSKSRRQWRDRHDVGSAALDRSPSAAKLHIAVDGKGKII